MKLGIGKFIIKGLIVITVQTQPYAFSSSQHFSQIYQKYLKKYQIDKDQYHQLKIDPSLEPKNKVESQTPKEILTYQERDFSGKKWVRKKEDEEKKKENHIQKKTGDKSSLGSTIEQLAKGLPNSSVGRDASLVSPKNEGEAKKLLPGMEAFGADSTGVMQVLKESFKDKQRMSIYGIISFFIFATFFVFGKIWSRNSTLIGKVIKSLLIMALTTASQAAVFWLFFPNLGPALSQILSKLIKT